MLCSCCCENINDLDNTFGTREAQKDAARYRKRGLPKRAQLLTAPLRQARDLTVMEIGCGAGAVHQDLLRNGIATQVIGVDASSAYLAAATENAAHFDLTDQITYHNTDFAQAAADFDAVDVVILDRVICCYPHLDKLLGQAAQRANQYLALSFPIEAGWLRLGFKLVDTMLSLFGSKYHPFLHAHADIQQYATAGGLKLISKERKGIWQVMVFGRG